MTHGGRWLIFWPCLARVGGEKRATHTSLSKSSFAATSSCGHRQIYIIDNRYVLRATISFARIAITVVFLPKYVWKNIFLIINPIDKNILKIFYYIGGWQSWLNSPKKYFYFFIYIYKCITQPVPQA